MSHGLDFFSIFLISGGMIFLGGVGGCLITGEGSPKNNKNIRKIVLTMAHESSYVWKEVSIALS